MDPRLNPNLTPRPQPSMNDIRPPQPAASSPQPIAVPTPAQPAPMPAQVAAPAPVAPPPTSPAQPTTEVVQSIPLKMQAPPPAPAQTAQPIPTQPAHQEDELDKILQAVNNRVSEPIRPQDNSKTKKLAKNIGSGAAKAKDKVKVPKGMFGAMGVVGLVAVLLIGVAVFAYKQGRQADVAAKGPSQVGTSYTASDAIQKAGGSLVRPGDLDDFSTELQTKLNSLNDSQDFDSHSLSSDVIGL